MQIQHATLYPLEVPMSQPIKMAGETLTHAQTLLLRLVDEHGNEGWGEASSAPLMTGETLASITASTDYLVSRLIGVRVDAATSISAMQERVLVANPSAKSCHETALLDLLAQRARLPLYQLLAGDARPAGTGRLEMLHMLASGDLERELDEARRLRRQGYRQWKIKIGSGDTASDVRRIRALCAELRGDMVSADANQGLSIDAAGLIAAAGREAGLSFLEQPLPARMMAEMAKLHRASGLAMCADESISGSDDIAAHADAQAAQGVSLKLIKFGGTQALVEAGRFCIARGLQINLACKVAETTISAAATAHVGFALGQAAWGFSMSNRYLEQDVCSVPLIPIHGAVTTDQFTRPGLGFAPDAARLREFASKTLPVREFRA
jgi:L-alanine-DL-glutamate epimerase-like enolase superfamily enzyme